MRFLKTSLAAMALSTLSTAVAFAQDAGIAPAPETVPAAAAAVATMVSDLAEPAGEVA